MEILEQKPITNLEAKKIMDKKEKDEIRQLTYMQSISLEFLRKATAKINLKAQEEIAKKLQGEIPILKENHIASILNKPPKDIDDVDVLFSKERIMLDKSMKEKIVKIMKWNTSYILFKNLTLITFI